MALYFNELVKEIFKYKRVFLTGMMGCGKTYWAKKLSEISGIPSFDLDELIELETKKSVAEIFNQQGENYFRKKENEILKTFENKLEYILSVGGGTPCYFNQMEWMNENGITIWIDEPLETLILRLKSATDRPLIARNSSKNLAAYLQNLTAEREPFYKKATVHLQPPAITMPDFRKILCNE